MTAICASSDTTTSHPIGRLHDVDLSDRASENLGPYSMRHLLDAMHQKTRSTMKPRADAWSDDHFSQCLGSLEETDGGENHLNLATGHAQSWNQVTQPDLSGLSGVKVSIAPTDHYYTSKPSGPLHPSRNIEFSVAILAPARFSEEDKEDYRHQIDAELKRIQGDFNLYAPGMMIEPSAYFAADKWCVHNRTAGRNGWWENAMCKTLQTVIACMGPRVSNTYESVTHKDLHEKIQAHRESGGTVFQRKSCVGRAFPCYTSGPAYFYNEWSSDSYEEHSFESRRQ